MFSNNIFSLDWTKIDFNFSCVYLDECWFADIFKNQISKLVITFATNKTFSNTTKINIFINILTNFSKLRYLNFDASFDLNIKPMSFNWVTIQTFSSSSLKELHINTYDFNECLYLLDGRLNQLEKFYVSVFVIYLQPSAIKDKVYSFCKSDNF